jgi:putative transcriptional regulator
MPIRNRIRALMGERETKTGQRITAKAICQVTGITEKTLSRLINNETARVDFETLERLCEYFDCQPGDILIRLPNNTEAGRQGVVREKKA